MKSVILKNKKIEIINEIPPSLEGKKGAIIKVYGCGLCGSDIVKINDYINEKTIKPPVLGHEIVGEIVEINVECKNEGDIFKKGDIIAMGHHYPCFKCKYCTHGNYSMCETFKASNIHPCGFSEYIYASENHLKNTVFKKPNNLSFEEFSFLEPLSCCIRAIKRSGLKFGENNSSYNVLILGLGSIGILMGQAAKACRANVFGFDINEERLSYAEKYGIQFDDKIKYDIIFMTSGSNKAIETAIKLIDLGGRIVVFSSVKDDTGYTNNDIYYKELTVVGSYSPAPSDLALSYEFLSKNAVDVKSISTKYSLDNLNKAINDTKEGKILKAYIEI